MDIDDHTITLCYNARTKGDENPCDLCSPSKLMRRLTSLQGRREQGAPHTSGHCPLCSHIQSHGSTQDEHLPSRKQVQQDEIVSKMPGAAKKISFCDLPDHSTALDTQSDYMLFGIFLRMVRIPCRRDKLGRTNGNRTTIVRRSPYTNDQQHTFRILTRKRLGAIS